MHSHRPESRPARTGLALTQKLGCWLSQNSGYLLVNNQPGVSHESIYQRIYADKRKGGSLHLTLRCQKVRKKRHIGRARRGSIPNQVSIDLRPAIVAERARFGDWEATWSLGPDRNRRLSQSTNAPRATR